MDIEALQRMIQNASSALKDFELNGDSSRTGVFDKLRAVGDVCIENNDIHPELKNRIALTEQYNFKNAALGLRGIYALTGGRNNNQGLHKNLSLMKSTLLKISKNEFEASTTELTSDKKKENNNKVFIVHGHDELAKVSVARFVEKIGLTPIILHEQASSSKTIIEKIESYGDVGFALVLYTPCDTGAKAGGETSPRARQNVVFEHGYFIGRLGRSKVTALVKGGVETPNDISGVVYIDLDDRGAWKMDVAKELKHAGYEVDLSGAL